MARNIQVLLVENVDGTGIVGDVVHVRKGFARNYLLPRSMATTPDEKKIKDLQAKRKDAIKHLGELRQARQALIEKLKGHEITMVRAVNDLGILYAAVTQHEIANELEKGGFHGIADREVRIGAPIKRIGDYALTIKFQVQEIPEEEAKGVKAAKTKAKAGASTGGDLEAEIKLHVKPDRELHLGRRDEDRPAAPATDGAEAAPAEGEVMVKRQKDKSAKFETAKPGVKEGKEDKAEAKAEKKSTSVWGPRPTQQEEMAMHEAKSHKSKGDKEEKEGKKGKKK